METASEEEVMDARDAQTHFDTSETAEQSDEDSNDASTESESHDDETESDNVEDSDETKTESDALSENTADESDHELDEYERIRRQNAEMQNELYKELGLPLLHAFPESTSNAKKAPQNDMGAKTSRTTRTPRTRKSIERTRRSLRLALRPNNTPIFTGNRRQKRSSEADMCVSLDEQMLMMLRLENFQPVIPDEVTQYWLHKNGLSITDSRVVRLCSLYMQMEIERVMKNGSSYAPSIQNANGSETRVMDMKVIARSLERNGMQRIHKLTRDFDQGAVRAFLEKQREQQSQSSTTSRRRSTQQ